jgi:hypothetical protein
MKLLLILLAVCVCSASAIVCPRNYCANVQCLPLDAQTCASQNAVLTPNASFCGCCPACITQLSMIIIVVIVIIPIVINTKNFDPFCW